MIFGYVRTPLGGFVNHSIENNFKLFIKEDWDDCIDSVMDQGKSQKDAEKICGAINRDYVGNYR